MIPAIHKHATKAVLLALGFLVLFLLLLARPSAASQDKTELIKQLNTEADLTLKDYMVSDDKWRREEKNAYRLMCRYLSVASALCLYEQKDGCERQKTAESELEALRLGDCRNLSSSSSSPLHSSQ